MSTDRDAAAALWEANAETWTQQARAGYDVYRDVVNTPAFLAMLPPVAGLRGLDIGCGEGSGTRAVAKLGAQMDAIDIAPTFIAHALASERLDPLGIMYQVGDAQELPYDDESFDFAVAFMSFMDVPDYRTGIAEAFRVIRPGGFLQISILHPCFMPLHRRVVRDASGTPLAIEIARYFDHADGEIERLTFSAAPNGEQRVAPFAIPRYHHTLGDWINAVIDAGFAIEQLGEPQADRQTALQYPIVADTRIAPLFLHILARRTEITSPVCGS